MMRLVFLLSAEERGLLLLDDPLLRPELRRLHPARAAARGWPTRPARKCWSAATTPGAACWRPSAPSTAASSTSACTCPPTAAACSIPTASPSWKDASRAHRWQDTPAAPCPINNRTVLHLLEALQMLQVQVPGGGPAEARRLQLPRARHRADRPRLRGPAGSHRQCAPQSRCWAWTGPKDKEPEVVPLSELEAARRRARRRCSTASKSRPGARPARCARRASIEAGPARAPGTLRAACGNDDALYQRVLPFAGLVREDDYGTPVVIPAGSVYVTAGTTAAPPARTTRRAA